MSDVRITIWLHSLAAQSLYCELTDFSPNYLVFIYGSYLH